LLVGIDDSHQAAMATGRHARHSPFHTSYYLPKPLAYTLLFSRQVTKMRNLFVSGDEPLVPPYPLFYSCLKDAIRTISSSDVRSGLGLTLFDASSMPNSATFEKIPAYISEFWLAVDTSCSVVLEVNAATAAKFRSYKRLPPRLAAVALARLIPFGRL